MNIDDAFPSKYLKASDLPEEGSQPAKIEKIQIEEVGQQKQKKPVVHFEDLDKPLILNKTNAKVISSLTGSGDFDDWIGKTINLYRAEVEFQGDMVEAIRVRRKTPDKTKTANDDNSIPF